MINAEQKKKLIGYLNEFKLYPVIINEGVKEQYNQFDDKRIEAIVHLRVLLNEFLSRKISLKEFKEKSETSCREYPYWGFKNFSGQMQLNQYTNNIESSDKESFLREALLAPKTKNDAIAVIDKMAEYLLKFKEKTDNPKLIPRISQTYMLSYFWELQDYEHWTVYYGSTKKVLLSLGFPLDVCESFGREYSLYLDIIKEIKDLFKSEGVKEKYISWYIEHVLWVQFMKLQTQRLDEKGSISHNKEEKIIAPGSLGEWIPPVISDLEDLAFNKETQWSKKRNLKPEKVFETKLRYAFTLLGYETVELGQGTGREPDGVALSLGVADGDYAVVYDAKARETKYSIGTQDREIYEYIQKKKEELRRKRINKLYFVIVSSIFDEGGSNLNLVKDVYRRTQVPVTFLSAADLLFIIEAKLQSPEIDHARLEYLFLDTGIINREKISDVLGLR